MEHLLQFLEFLGMVFSMAGAYLMSRDSRKMPNHLYLAFISFGISNIFMIVVSLYHGVTPLLIQMALFATSSYMGIISQSNNFQRDKNIMTSVIVIYSLAMIMVYNYANITFHFDFTLADTTAAIIAIAGSFVLKSHDLDFRLNAFIAFFVADVIYVFVAYDHGMYFFMTQSAFFLYTSIEGYRNTKKVILTFSHA